MRSGFDFFQGLEMRPKKIWNHRLQCLILPHLARSGSLSALKKRLLASPNTGTGWPIRIRFILCNNRILRPGCFTMLTYYSFRYGRRNFPLVTESWPPCGGASSGIRSRNARYRYLISQFSQFHRYGTVICRCHRRVADKSIFGRIRILHIRILKPDPGSGSCFLCKKAHFSCPAYFLHGL